MNDYFELAKELARDRAAAVAVVLERLERARKDKDLIEYRGYTIEAIKERHDMHYEIEGRYDGAPDALGPLNRGTNDLDVLKDAIDEELERTKA